MFEDKDIVKKTAKEIIDLLKAEEISPLELLDILENRIEEVDARINALPILCFDRGRQHANQLMTLPVEERGPLAGLPIAIKDLTPVANVRFTSGSLLFKDYIAEESDPLVELLEKRGGIIYAKSNTPEFGSGGNTFNDVFGPTVNPWDLTKSVAGSSGGSAAALASGTAWLAHGSDLGGSLRNPASFCGIVGLRPSPGRVITSNKFLPFQTLGVQGPMARNVADVALFLDAMISDSGNSPVLLPNSRTSFYESSQAKLKPKKVAFSVNLGYTSVDPEVANICKVAAFCLEKFGVIVEEADPDVVGVMETFWTLRSNLFATLMGDMVEKNGNKMMPELVDNTKEGLKLQSEEIRKAEIARGNIYNVMVKFFEEYDLLLTPSTIVPPFPVENRYVESCDGQVFEKYVDWLGIAFLATLASCPSISLPVGTNKDSLPIGIQAIGPNQGEAFLLSAAQFFEDIIGQSPVPINPKLTL